MTMNKAIRLVVCIGVAALSSACFGFERKSTVAGPSAAGIGTLLGSWSAANIIPTPGTCTDFKWNVTEQTGTTAKGAFSATCPGDLKLSGTAQGTLSGSTITWSAQGVGNGPGLMSCNISLTGTAEIGVTSVRVPYSGTTCLGPVSGTEVMRRN
jgi:hypothetical protein